MSLPVNLGLFGGGLAIGAVGSYFASRPRGEPRAAQPVSATAAAVPVPAAPAATTGTPAVVAASAVPFFSRDTLKWTGTNPGPVSDLLENQSYVAGYDRRLRHPAWTAEHISAQTLLRGPQPPGAPPRGDRKKSAFHEDERVPLPFRAHLADYFRSGYDRGHMVPASDARINQQAMNETFALSNICPQVGEGFNRDYWAGVEEYVRDLTSKFADLYVFTVPLYLPKPDPYEPGKFKVEYEVIGNPPNVAVPTHFAKVILALQGANPPADKAPSALVSTAGALALGAFVIPNQIVPNSTPLRKFNVPVDAVERAAGLTLFSPAVKSKAKSLCDVAGCEVIIRQFNDTKNKVKAIPAPN